MYITNILLLAVCNIAFTLAQRGSNVYSGSPSSGTYYYSGQNQYPTQYSQYSQYPGQHSQYPAQYERRSYGTGSVQDYGSSGGQSHTGYTNFNMRNYGSLPGQYSQGNYGQGSNSGPLRASERSYTSYGTTGTGSGYSTNNYPNYNQHSNWGQNYY